MPLTDLAEVDIGGVATTLLSCFADEALIQMKSA